MGTFQGQSVHSRMDSGSVGTWREEYTVGGVWFSRWVLRRIAGLEVEVQWAPGTGSGALHDVEVNHRGFDRGVAHQVLDGADVGS